MTGRALPVPLWRAAQLARRVYYRLARGRADAGDMDRLAARLATKTDPIKVGFVVCAPSKWSAQTLFDALAADARFTPSLYPTLSDTELRASRAQRRQAYAATKSFFSGIGPVAHNLYDPATDRMANADAIDADIVFIQQPWGMQDLPRRLHHRALCAYVHYGYPVISNDMMQFGLPDFHAFLWCHFVPDTTQSLAMGNSSKPQARHVFTTGHPKLDAYLSPSPDRHSVAAWPRAHQPQRKRIIFAPHHTLGAHTLNLSTFKWSGPAIAALAQAHPEIDFILKPHPNLEYEMRRNGGALAAIYDNFVAQWAAAPNTATVQGGGYFDLFRSSDAMITDSGSFLAEYLPTGKPLLRLTKIGSAPLNASGAALEPAFYDVPEADTLGALFQTVILENDDPLDAARRAAVARIMPDNRPSAARITDHLRELLDPSR